MFIIFTYNTDGRQHVEAYPIYGRPIEDVVSGLAMQWMLVFAPSKNQARKLAYKLWIRADGKDFNKFPLH